MFPQSDQKILPVEAPVDDLMDCHQYSRNIMGKNLIGNPEIIGMIEDVQVFGDSLICQVVTGKADELVEE